MENKIATVVWNEFIAQTANNGINFSFTDLEKRIKETMDAALRQTPVSGSVCELDEWDGGDETNLCDCGKGEGWCKRKQTLR